MTRIHVLLRRTPGAAEVDGVVAAASGAGPVFVPSERPSPVPGGDGPAGRTWAIRPVPADGSLDGLVDRARTRLAERPLAAAGVP